MLDIIFLDCHPIICHKSLTLCFHSFGHLCTLRCRDRPWCRHGENACTRVGTGQLFSDNTCRHFEFLGKFS